MLVAVGPQSRFSRTFDSIPKALDPEINYVLNTEVARFHGTAYSAHLSIKAPSSGTGNYETDNGRHEANTSGYLVLNANQQTSLTITSRAAGTNIYLSCRLVADVYRNSTTDLEQLVDDPEVETNASPEFLQRSYPHDAMVSPVLGRIQKSMTERITSRGWFEDQLHCLVQQLLVAQHKICSAEMTLLPAARPGTRYELYRRIYRARDYMIASMDQPLTLIEMARVACLSPNHFIRTFKQMFRMTPYQFLTEQRLKRAMELLVDTELSVTDITYMVGFESLGSFSWLFRRRLGVSPQAFRTHKRERKIMLVVPD